MLRTSLLSIGALAHAGTLKRLGNKGPMMKTETDVVIVGGGPAGLAAALALGRTGRRVIIYDDNKGRNFPAAHMMNFPSRDGTPPREFKELILKDLRKYTEVEIRSARAQEITKEENGFLVNKEVRASKIVLAHGVRDVLPDVPGLKELWGRSVFHCPYCHGHEFKGRKIGVMNSDQNYLRHMLPLLLGLSDSVTVFTNGAPVELPSPLLRRTTIVTTKVRELAHDGDDLKSVVVDDGAMAIDGLVIKPPQVLTSDVGTRLGCELNELGLYKTDAEGMTTVRGVYAAGDIADARQAVVLACASGMKAAASLNMALLLERLEI